MFGPDPYHMIYLFSDTPFPPSESVIAFPFEQTWWTVKAYDQYGSTIYADPLQIYAENVRAQIIENLITGQRYASIQQAINDAHPGDEIVVGPGACQYLENINFKGKNLTLRSVDPNDPAVVAATVIDGGHRGSVVSFSGGEEGNCVLDGFTLTGGIVGISSRDAYPTIRNCTIGSAGTIAIQFWHGYEPTIIDCTILGLVKEQDDPRLVADWRLDEKEGIVAHDSAKGNDGTVQGGAAWQPEGGMIDGALQLDGIDDYVSTEFVLNPADGAFSVFAWLKGGAPGQVIISQQAGVNWLMADPSEGKLMTELKSAGRTGTPLLSQAIITDGEWHRIGFVSDGANRALYVDGVVAAQDTQTGLKGSGGGLYIGVGENYAAGTFFSGMIDDVRIYNRAVKP